jgi:hypothetical protein
MIEPSTHLFSPLTLRGVTLPNRIVISPMQQYSAEPDGVPNAFHRQHYGRLSLGGPGLLERWPPSWGWWLEKRARVTALAETSTSATGG